MKRMAQISTVVFALVMLAGYVVYSQRQQSRTVAPGSKVMALDEVRTGMSSETNRTTSAVSNEDSMLVFPGSKSSRMITVRPAAPAVTATNVPARPVATKMAPSSKSGRVFDLESTQAVSRTALSSTNRPAARRSAGVADRIAAEKRAARTNAPAATVTGTQP